MDINSMLTKEIEENFPENLKEIASIILEEIYKGTSNKEIESIILDELREISE